MCIAYVQYMSMVYNALIEVYRCDINLLVAEHDFKILDALWIGRFPSTGASECLINDGCLPLLDLQNPSLYGVGHLIELSSWAKASRSGAHDVVLHIYGLLLTYPVHTVDGCHQSSGGYW